MRIFLDNGNFYIKNGNEISKLINDGFNIKRNGRIEKIDALFLHEFRNAKIFEKNNEASRENVMKLFTDEEIKKYKIYSDLRNRGYVIKINGSWFIKNKLNGEFEKFYIFNAKENFKPNVFEEKKGFIAVFDPLLETNYYSFFFEDPAGEFQVTYENPYMDEFEKDVICDLLKRGCSVKSGLKFGTEFIVYLKKEDKHSRYMVKIYLERMVWLDITALVRVSHGVKKILLIAFKENGIKYLGFSWIRP